MKSPDSAVALVAVPAQRADRLGTKRYYCPGCGRPADGPGRYCERDYGCRSRDPAACRQGPHTKESVLATIERILSGTYPWPEGLTPNEVREIEGLLRAHPFDDALSFHLELHTGGKEGLNRLRVSAIEGRLLAALRPMANTRPDYEAVADLCIKTLGEIGMTCRFPKASYEVDDRGEKRRRPLDEITVAYGGRIPEGRVTFHFGEEVRIGKPTKEEVFVAHAVAAPVDVKLDLKVATPNVDKLRDSVLRALSKPRDTKGSDYQELLAASHEASRKAGIEETAMQLALRSNNRDDARKAVAICTGFRLDRLGAFLGMKRAGVETDETYRNRLFGLSTSEFATAGYKKLGADPASDDSRKPYEPPTAKRVSPALPPK